MNARAAGACALLYATALVAAAVSTALADGDVARGEKRFEECAACHSVERGSNRIGPSLHGVFGRKAGAMPEFRYSPALRRSGITWTRESLDSYIADPQKAVPANRMPYAGMLGAADRADLIAYLERATK